MKVNGQLHTSTTYPPAECALLPTNSKLIRPQDKFECFGRREKFRAGYPAHIPVSIQLVISICCSSIQPNYLQRQNTTCLPSPWHLNTSSQEHKVACFTVCITVSLLIFYFRPNIRNTITDYVCCTCQICAGRCSISITLFFITVFR